MARPDRLVAASAGLATAVALVILGLREGAFDVVDRQVAGLLLWWAIALGALVTRRGPQRPAVAGFIATAFGIAIPLWIALGLGSSISQERTAIELARAVVHLAPIVLIGWVLPASWWRWVLGGAAAGATVLVLLALGDRLSPGLLGQQTTIVFLNTTARLANPLGYWNAVASWCVIAVMLLLAIGTHAPARWLRALALLPVPAVIVTASLTYSRSAAGAVLIGLLVLLAGSRHRWTLALTVAGAAITGGVGVAVAQGKPEIADATGTAGAGAVLLTVVLAGLVLAALGLVAGRVADGRAVAPRLARVSVAAATVAVVVAGVVVIGHNGQRWWDQFNTPEVHTGNAADRLTTLNTTRADQWRIALDAWKAHKARGEGAGTFELINNQNAKTTEFVRDAHNAFIETLAEQGTLGFLILVGFVLSAAATALIAIRRTPDSLGRGLAAGAAAGFAAFIFGTSLDWFWELTALALLALTLLGALVAAGREARLAELEAAAPGAERPVAGGGRTWPARVAVVALAVVAMLVLLPGLVGTSEVRRSQQAVQAGDLAAARSHADQAIETMPWASSAYLQRALVDEQAGAYGASRRGLQLAIERDPQDWRIPLVLARVEAEDGRPKAALEAYRQAKQLRPNGQFFR